jgi:DNA-binding NarL/FixJ family response regulator
MPDATGPSAERILAFIMLDLMPSSATTVERTVRLNQCGFSNPDIAVILSISTSAVGTNLHAARKKAGAPRKATKASRKA